MKRLVSGLLAAVMALALPIGEAVAPPAEAAALTFKIAVNNTSWTDITVVVGGTPGSLLISADGPIVYAIGDATAPSIPVNQGYRVAAYFVFTVNTSAHVWAMSQNVSGANVFAAPAASGGGGGGGPVTAPLGQTAPANAVSVTENSTPITGQVLSGTGGVGIQGWLSQLHIDISGPIPAGTNVIGGTLLPVGAAAFTPGQVGGSGVLTTATLIAAARTGAPGTGRVSITIINNTGSDQICLGGATVTAATGLCLPAIAGASMTLNTTAAIYGIAPTTAQAKVSFAETY